MNIYRLSTTVLKDRDSCMEWLREKGLLPSLEKWCPRCTNKLMTYQPHGLGRYRCRRNHSGRGPIELSAAQGTWFENVKMTLEKVVLLTYCFAQQYNHQQCIHESSLSVDNITSPNTVVDWYSYCREVCMCALDERYTDEGLIGGPGHIVQIDETKVGKRKYNRGRFREGNWILGMIDSEGGYRLEICPENKRDRDTLFPLITKHVAPGTEIHRYVGCI